jgi:hypothetical protein
MTDHYFNSLEYARQLEAAGVPKAQAAVHANALGHVLEQCLSTAEGTAELSFKISESEMTLRAEIKEVEARIRAEISGLEGRLRAEIADRIDRLETRMHWICGVIVATQVGLFAMVAGLYIRL